MISVLEKAETREILRPVETDLLRQTGGSGVEWFGRAATALYRAYQIAQRCVRTADKEAEVILPSISCATPANTALLAGVSPRFADVDPATGMPTLETIQQRWTPNTCAVVFIHLFGQTADLCPLAQWCRERKILLIEDIAQALGARLPDGTGVGSVGDLSVYSFSPTKILECGGGCLLLRSKELISVSKEVSAVAQIPREISEAEAKSLGLSYRNLHHSLVALLRHRAIGEVSSAFLKVQPAFRGLYLRPMKNPAALLNAWPRLPDVLRHRHVNAEKYDAALSNGPWKRLHRWHESGVCWRYSLLVDFPDKLVQFSETVRHDGFHVSNLYWPVNDFFRPSDECPNAASFARRIVNLWVDQTVDQEWVQRCAESLLRNAERFVS
jgi:dTDP-4-amino-4,6-dideoxygalactose transaminase